jgi:hypothetical protein
LSHWFTSGPQFLCPFLVDLFFHIATCYKYSCAERNKAAFHPIIAHIRK